MTRSALLDRLPRAPGTSVRRTLLAAAVLWPFMPWVPLAEAQRPRVAPVPPVAPTPGVVPAPPVPGEMAMPRAFAMIAPQPNRAALGVGLRTGTRADTLGLEIMEVSTDGPAARAGLTVGMRIEEINGVSLRLSADDADDPRTADAGYRRLQRVMAQVEPGDAVTLRIRDGAQRRTVSVATVSSAELARARVVSIAGTARGTRESLRNRASLGLGVTSSGNVRDTLGLFITSVMGHGPADSAGVIEGERIAAVNGVDVRVPPEDVGDDQAGAARLARLTRTLDGVSPGDRVTLRVFGGGRYREVQITARAASDVGGSPLMLRVPGATISTWREIADNQTGLNRVY
jgi:serine protease Do